jgi:hypothetical protein
MTMLWDDVHATTKVSEGQIDRGAGCFALRSVI